MGAGKSKAASCPFTELLQAKRDRAKSRRFTEGEASTFYFLCKDGKTDEVRQILEAEDCPSIDELNKVQPNGSTPLHAAAYYNHPEIVQLLLERDCPRTELNRFSNTAYDEAQTREMKQLFNRFDSSNRFHETNAADAMALYVPEQNIESTNTGTTPD
jgi:ankyrin repeat protein